MCFWELDLLCVNFLTGIHKFYYLLSTGVLSLSIQAELNNASSFLLPELKPDIPISWQ